MVFLKAPQLKAVVWNTNYKAKCAGPEGKNLRVTGGSKNEQCYTGLYKARMHNQEVEDKSKKIMYTHFEPKTKFQTR